MSDIKHEACDWDHNGFLFLDMSKTTGQVLSL